MKKNLSTKMLALFLCALLGASAIPSFAVLPDDLEVFAKTGFVTALPAPPALHDGEVWVNRSAASDDIQPSATVSLSAIGQAYNAPTVNLLPNNIVFVLDVSTSMQDNGKAANLASSANSAVDALSINNNQIGIVTFGTTANLKRGLSTAPVTLKTSGSDTLNGVSDSINVYPPFNNGTNVQAGLNVAYNTLKAAKNAGSDATPVIILLTDGAPTYYYSNIQGLRTSGALSGDGGSTDNSCVGYTIVQAAYLKALMPELRIYTIGFDTAGNARSAATLNPTSANIDAISSHNHDLNDDLAEIVNETVPSAMRSQIVYNYPNGAYSASNSTGSLNTALNAIIRGIKVSTPVAESKTNPTDSTLTESSYISITDKIGAHYALAGAMTVQFRSASYSFASDGAGNYAYTAKPSDTGYNGEIARLKILYDKTTNTVTWKIPGTVLPCRDPSGAGAAVDPIILRYVVTLDGADLEEGTYDTSGNCGVAFTPAKDNPFYSSSNSTAYPSVTNTTTYFEATFPSGSGSNKTLLSFATGNDAGNLTPDPNPGSLAARYTSYGTPHLDVTYSGKTLTFNNPTLQTATASFTATNRADKSTYSVASFAVGTQSYSDAAVSSVTQGNPSDRFNITVRYGDGKYTLTFANVQMSNTVSSTANAVFRASTRNPTKLSQMQISSLEVDGQAASGSITDYDRSFNILTFNYDYDITVSCNGHTYEFEDVRFSSNSSGGWRTSQSVSDTITYEGSPYKSAATSAQFYFAQTTAVTSNFSYSFDESTRKITLTIAGTGTLTFRESYANGTDTQIVEMADGGYLIRQTTGSGNTTTVTTYTLTAGELSKTVSVSTPSGPKSASAGTSGTIALKSNNIIDNVKLRSQKDTGVAIANAAGIAPVVLSFTSTRGFTNLTFALSSAQTGSAFTSYSVMGTGGGLVKNADGTFSAPAAGSYSIQLNITYPSAAPDSFWLYFQQINYKTLSLNDKVRVHESDFANQKVKIVMNSPSGH